jgi:hypothetical protein
MATPHFDEPGVTTATWLMMIGGYMSGVAMLSPELGGLGWTDTGKINAEIWTKILPLPQIIVI